MVTATDAGNCNCLTPTAPWPAAPAGATAIPSPTKTASWSALNSTTWKSDVSEAGDVAAANPETVKRLEAFAEQARKDLGDALTHRDGAGRREPGRVPPVDAPK